MPMKTRVASKLLFLLLLFVLMLLLLPLLCFHILGIFVFGQSNVSVGYTRNFVFSQLVFRGFSLDEIVENASVCNLKRCFLNPSYLRKILSAYMHVNLFACRMHCTQEKR